MFDANGHYTGRHKRPKHRSTAPSPAPQLPPPPPPPPPAPSSAIAADLHPSLLPFLTLPSTACPPTFAQWLTLPPALLTRHVRKEADIALLRRIAASASRLDGLMERLYAAMVDGESIERVRHHLPHRCPSLPDPAPAAVSSNASESSSSSSSSDSSAAAAAAADASAAQAALSASLAPFFQCTFPSAHDPSFPASLSSAMGEHVRSIGGVFVELTGVLLELRDQLGALESVQQRTAQVSEDLQLEGYEAPAAMKAAVAALESNMVDRITALLSARLTYQRQQTEVTQAHPPAASGAAAAIAAAVAVGPVSLSSSSAAPATKPASTPNRNSVDAEMRPSQPLPPDSPSPSVASASSSSAASSSSSSSSSLSPNTRLDVILGLQPAAGVKRKAHSALDAEQQHSMPLPLFDQSEGGKDEKDGDQPLCRSQPVAKRKRTEHGNRSDAVEVQQTDNDLVSAIGPSSMRVLFTPAPGTSGDCPAGAQSVPDSPLVVPSAPPGEGGAAATTALERRPASPVCDMQLSFESSTSSSAAPASPSSCPPSPVVSTLSPRLSASQPTQTAALCSSLSRLTTLVARSHSIGHITATADGKRVDASPAAEHERLVGIDNTGAAAVRTTAGPAGSVPLSPNIDMSVDDADDADNERQHRTSSNPNPSTAAETAATEAASIVFVPPTRTLSHSRCSQERGDADVVAGVDAEGSVGVQMAPVDTDPLQLHSSQPQTMV